jgi:branched-chain amino acid transport system substrate-binding protein
MRARAALVGLAAIALALGGCSGSSDAPVRIGILSDCYGPFSDAHELIVASAEVPLVAHGGRLRGPTPTDGVEGATFAGRRVELLIGCVTGTQDVIPEARRLVEEEGAQILVGPLYPNHGPVLRDYARRHLDTAFLIQPSGAPELTLSHPSQNVFRFTIDNAQSAAGLGTYAYRTLGWRAAATVSDDTPYGWGTVAGFVAEFCALGGRVVQRDWIPLGKDPTGFADRIPAAADGVYIGGALSSMAGFVREYSSSGGDAKTRIVGDSALLYDPWIVKHAKLVTAGTLPLQPTSAGRAYMAAFTRVFPTFPPAAALNTLAVPYRDGVTAVLDALERTDGATGSPLVTALSRVVLDSPTGRIRLDANRQAVGPNYLQAVTAGAKRPIETIRVVPEVEQTFGGYFQPEGTPPSRTSPDCKRHVPPAWSRP